MKALCRVQSFKQTSKQVLFCFLISKVSQRKWSRQMEQLFRDSGNEELLFIGASLYQALNETSSMGYQLKPNSVK